MIVAAVSLLDRVAEAGWVALAASFLGGLVSSVNPCVIATILLLIGFTASYAKDPRRSAVWALAFAFGTVLAFTALGLVAAQVGTFLGLISRRWYLLLAALTAWMGLQTLHVLPSPAWSTPGVEARGKGAWIALLVGGMATIILSPCATPVLITVLGLAATRGPSAGTALLFAYGLGRAVPLLAVGFSGGLVQRELAGRTFKRFAETGRLALGAAILLLALYFVYLAL